MSTLAEESLSNQRVRDGVLEGVREDAPSSKTSVRLSVEPTVSWDRCVLDEESFHRAIALERRRTERSRKPFLLMLLDIGHLPEGEGRRFRAKFWGCFRWPPAKPTSSDGTKEAWSA